VFTPDPLNARAPPDLQPCAYMTPQRSHLAYWSLDLLWMLDAGVWSFPIRSWPHDGTYQVFLQSNQDAALRALRKSLDKTRAI